MGTERKYALQTYCKQIVCETGVRLQGCVRFVCLPACEFRGEFGEQVVGVGTAAGLGG